MALFSTARFVASAHELHELPPDFGAEVAFAGRSNAGKSSALNALTQRKRLAFVSKTPGRTQTINFFECDGNRRLVDLPGYGYAAVPQKERAHWGKLISAYLQNRRSLRGLVLIVDARHPLTPLDRQLLEWHAASGQPVLVLLTKADKLTRGDAAKHLAAANALLPELHPAATAQLFSAVAGTGQRSAYATVAAWLTSPEGAAAPPSSGPGNKKPPVKGE
ncbi:MAG TPA: ribosome biogenesis GTP-binding protein YihA/YsxC [Burkholderiales bacterium]|nr:ribosome biogenesis GTP-binding protein YihA/YsxC [Burkholderiales bacterium]